MCLSSRRFIDFEDYRDAEDAVRKLDGEKLALLPLELIGCLRKRPPSWKLA
jgi:hypothetical protein